MQVLSWERPIDPDFALCILESTTKYWDKLTSYGERFYIGGSGACTFQKAQPLCYSVLAHLGYEGKEVSCEEDADYSIQLDGIEKYFKWGNVKKVCEEQSFIEKLREDKDFRKKALEGTLVKRRDL